MILRSCSLRPVEWLVLLLGLSACATAPKLGDHPRRLQADEAAARHDWMQACALYARWSNETEKHSNQPQRDYAREKLQSCAGEILPERMARIEQARTAGRTDEALVLARCLGEWLDSPKAGYWVKYSPAGERAKSLVAGSRKSWVEGEIARARAQIAQGGEAAMEGARRIEALFLTKELNTPRVVTDDVLLEAFKARIHAIAEAPEDSLQNAARAQFDSIEAVFAEAQDVKVPDKTGWQYVPVREKLAPAIAEELARLDLTRGAHGVPLRLKELTAIARRLPQWTAARDRLWSFLYDEAKAYSARAKELHAQGRTGLALGQARLAELVAESGAGAVYEKELKGARHFRWSVERAGDACGSVTTPAQVPYGAGVAARVVVRVTQCDVEQKSLPWWEATSARSWRSVEKCAYGKCWYERVEVEGPPGSGPTVRYTEVDSKGRFAARLELIGPWGTHTEEVRWEGEEDGRRQPGDGAEDRTRQSASLLGKFGRVLAEAVQAQARAGQQRWSSLAALPEPPRPAGDDTEWKADLTVRRWALGETAPDGGWEAVYKLIPYLDAGWTKRLIENPELVAPQRGLTQIPPSPVTLPWAGQACPADFVFPDPGSLPALTVPVPEPEPEPEPVKPYVPPEPDTFQGYGGFSLTYLQPRPETSEGPQRYALSLGGVFLPDINRESATWSLEGHFGLGASAAGNVLTDGQFGMGGAFALWRFVLVPALLVGFDRDDLGIDAHGADQIMNFRMYAGLGGRLMLRVTDKVLLEGWGQLLNRKDPTVADSDYFYAPGSEGRYGARLVLRGVPFRIFWLGARVLDYGDAENLGGELGVYF